MNATAIAMPHCECCNRRIAGYTSLCERCAAPLGKTMYYHADLSQVDKMAILGSECPHFTTDELTP